MPETELRCPCEFDYAETRYSRQCDYCGTAWGDVRCPHDEYQSPCPECDVVPVAQPL